MEAEDLSEEEQDLLDEVWDEVVASESRRGKNAAAGRKRRRDERESSGQVEAGDGRHGEAKEVDIGLADATIRRQEEGRLFW